ncbi:glucose-6-phosphate isomerase, partial [Spiromyces aspiralis]
MVLPTQLEAWQALQAYYDQVGKSLDMRDLFAADPLRFETYSRKIKLVSRDGEHGAEFLVDFSKNRVNNEIFALLLRLAEEAGVERLRDQMFTGDHINFTEDRAVLHIALRNVSPDPIFDKGHDVMPGVREVLAHMKEFSSAVRNG